MIVDIVLKGIGLVEVITLRIFIVAVEGVGEGKGVGYVIGRYLFGY